MEPLNGGPLAAAGTQEQFARLLMAFVNDIGAGPLFYRFAPPETP